VERLTDNNSHTMGLNIRLYGDGCLVNKMFRRFDTGLLCCLVYSKRTKIIIGGPTARGLYRHVVELEVVRSLWLSRWKCKASGRYLFPVSIGKHVGLCFHNTLVSFGTIKKASV
jgi:hypothetical protein